MSNTEINQVLANSLSPGELPFPGSPRKKHFPSPFFLHMHARPACVYRDPRQPLSRIHLVAPSSTHPVMLTISQTRVCAMRPRSSSRKPPMATLYVLPSLRHPTSLPPRDRVAGGVPSPLANHDDRSSPFTSRH